MTCDGDSAMMTYRDKQSGLCKQNVHNELKNTVRYIYIYSKLRYNVPVGTSVFCPLYTKSVLRVYRTLSVIRIYRTLSVIDINRTLSHSLS